MPYFPGSRARFPGNFVNSVNRLDSFFSRDEVQVDQLARNESVRSWDELRAANDDPESKKLQRHRYHLRYAHCHQGADGCCARRTVAGPDQSIGDAERIDPGSNQLRGDVRKVSHVTTSSIYLLLHRTVRFQAAVKSKDE